MRTLGEIPNPECKISLFSWNGKYLVKFEQGPFEQTFKFDHLEFEGEADLKNRLDAKFIRGVVSHFAEMARLQFEV
ncbi:MAG: hypothetical protein V4692_11490 [Bdellovibrionota bacterium]